MISRFGWLSVEWRLINQSKKVSGGGIDNSFAFPCQLLVDERSLVSCILQRGLLPTNSSHFCRNFVVTLFPAIASSWINVK